MPTEPKDLSLQIAWVPALLYAAGKFQSGRALVCDASGNVVNVASVDELREEKRVRLSGRAMLPEMINAHSHAFQRVLRGRTEYHPSPQPLRGGRMPAGSDGSPTLIEEKDSF